MTFEARTRAVLWGICVAILATVFLFQIRHGLVFDSDILALLPATEKDPVVERAMDVFAEKLGQKNLFLIGHEDAQTAREAASKLERQLRGSSWFKDVQGHLDENLERAFYEFYFPFRYQLLSRTARTNLQQPDQGGKRLVEQAEKALYSPMSGVFSGNLEQDPLLLLPMFLKDLPKPSGKLGLQEGWLTAKSGGKHYVLITASLAGNAFSRATQQRVMPFLRTLELEMETAFPGMLLLSTGLVKYAADGAQTAQKEISTIGLGSIAGIFVLMLAMFASFRPLLLGFAPVVIGLLAALVCCFAVFSRIHLITLGFGSSLIGVSIDYAFHYFCEQSRGESEVGKDTTLSTIFPAISLGALTSILGYMGMGLAPFPGLRQMALFSSVGLLGAFATVIFCFPWFSKPPTKGFLRQAKRLPQWYLRLWSPGRLKGFPLFFGLFTAGFIVFGLLRVRPNDDIRQLQTPPPDLLAEQQKIEAVLGAADHSRFLLVEGRDQEQTLIREEALNQVLEEFRNQGKIAAFFGISGLLPSRQRQRRNHELLRDALLAGTPTRLEAYMNRMGFKTETTAAAIARLGAPPERFATVASWLAQTGSQPAAHLWLGATPRGQASLVMLSGVADTAALADLEHRREGIHYIDKVADISLLLKRYRIQATRLVLLSYLIIFGLLVFRYGRLRGFLAMLPPVVAALFAIATFGVLGREINLFSMLALFLVLGIGIDYTIFFAEAHHHPGRLAATLLAILLSACTTLLSFGLLALSRMPVLRDFGITVLAGIGMALLLCPLAGAFSGPVAGRQGRIMRAALEES